MGGPLASPSSEGDAASCRMRLTWTPRCATAPTPSSTVEKSGEGASPEAGAPGASTFSQ